MKTREQILIKERLEYVREKREKYREEAFEASKSIIGKEALAELRELYNIYDERIYIWMAGLWHPEIGAFYYSNSARDTELYLPDIESTAQILLYLGSTKMLVGDKSPINLIPSKIRESIINFVLGLQDESGFFYHPQWGKDVSVSRRGRDLGWAKRILGPAGVSPQYPYPTAKRSDGTKSEYLPEYLQDIEKFKKYLTDMDLSTDSYRIGNIFDSTTTQITAAGPEFVETLLFWLAEHQRKDNGLWEEKINYQSVNGLMKISGCYPTLNAVLPNAYRGLESAIKVAASDERMKFVCEHYNPWIAMCNVFKGSQKSVAKDDTEKLRALLWENSAELIRKTREKILVFKKDDGTFSYFKKMSASISQGSPAAVPRTNEGDVNGTSISCGSARNMCVALGIPQIPFFCPADGDLFLELIENAPRIVKKYKNPGGDKFPDRVPYAEEIAE